MTWLACAQASPSKYLIVDDEKTPRDRVVLPHEDIESYDASYYETQLVRAVESILSPIGWDRTDIHRELSETREVDLRMFGPVTGE